MNIAGPAIVVGGGMAGLSAAYYLTKLGKVELYEKRVIGGLCVNYDKFKNAFIDAYREKFKELSYKPCVYGEHVFHSNSELAYSIFCELYNTEVYELQTVTVVDSAAYRWPLNAEVFLNHGVNIEELNSLKEKFPYGASLGELSSEISDTKNIDVIKERFITPYSIKQWGNNDYDSVLENRVRVFFDNEINTFRDRFQCIPLKMDYGDCKLLKNNNINVFNAAVDIDVIKDTYANKDNLTIVVNTGPIDEFYHLDKRLRYRTCDFIFGYDHSGAYANLPVSINTPSIYTAHTRIHNHNGILIYEYPRDYVPSRQSDIPMYPCKEAHMCEQLHNLPLRVIDTGYGEAYVDVDSVENVIILHVGRLGTYKYMNMDTTILNSYIATEWVCTHSIEDIYDLVSMSEYAIIQRAGEDQPVFIKDNILIRTVGLKTIYSSTRSEDNDNNSDAYLNMYKFYKHYFENTNIFKTPIVSYADTSYENILVVEKLYGSTVFDTQDTHCSEQLLSSFFENYIRHVKDTIYCLVGAKLEDKCVKVLEPDEYKLSCGIDVRGIIAFSHGELTLDKIVGRFNSYTNKFTTKMILPKGPTLDGQLLTDAVSVLEHAFFDKEFLEHLTSMETSVVDDVLSKMKVHFDLLMTHYYKPLIGVVLEYCNGLSGDERWSTPCIEITQENIDKYSIELVEMCKKIISKNNEHNSNSVDTIYNALI